MILGIYRNSLYHKYHRLRFIWKLSIEQYSFIQIMHSNRSNEWALLLIKSIQIINKTMNSQIPFPLISAYHCREIINGTINVVKRCMNSSLGIYIDFVLTNMITQNFNRSSIIFTICLTISSSITWHTHMDQYLTKLMCRNGYITTNT